jgi:hypothetical protein
MIVREKNSRPPLQAGAHHKNRQQIQLTRKPAVFLQNRVSISWGRTLFNGWKASAGLLQTTART